MTGMILCGLGSAMVGATFGFLFASILQISKGTPSDQAREDREQIAFLRQWQEARRAVR